MAIIEAKGLFSGDRLSRCSDEAQLHWVRLYSAANGFARIELNYRKLIAAAYSGFKRPPTEAKFQAWIQEYRDNFLLFVYRSASGTLWGQWSTDDRHLPRYKTAEDKRSPAPPKRELDAFNAKYATSKHTDERFGNILENIPTCTPDPVNTPIGVGGGDGEGKKQGGTRAHAKESGSAPEPPAPADPEATSVSVDAIICAHPKSRLRNLKPNEVRQRDQAAVLEAMMDEVKASGADHAAVLAMMIERTQLLADHVPRSEWRYFKNVSEFYRDHDYRLEPEDFTRSNSNGKNIGDSRSPAVRRVKDTGANWDSAIGQRLAGADGRDAETGVGGIPSPGISPRDNGSVPADVRGPGAGVWVEAPGDGAPIATEPPEILSPSQRSARGS